MRGSRLSVVQKGATRAELLAMIDVEEIHTSSRPQLRMVRQA